MATNILTVSRVRELLHYQPETGVFTWLFITSNRVKVGDVAGGFDAEGYRRISIDGHNYKAHRLAWLYVHGKWPVDQIDHIDCQKNNNRLCNLREATGSGNQQNQRAPGRGNTSGFLGVSWSVRAKKWKAQITVNGKKIYLGYFPAAELAHAAYLQAKEELHPFGTLVRKTVD